MVTTNGTFTTLAAFALNPDGANPYGPLVQGRDGNFYGTTVNGGTNGYYNVLPGARITFGTVFRLTTNGTLTPLAAFEGRNGVNPYAGLVQGSDGSFYGTTANGGTNGGYGTVFKIATNGTLISLVSFANTNGANPYAGLVQGSDGNFYGTTVNGGDNGCGTVLMVTTNGTFNGLYSFGAVGGFLGYPLDGVNPYGELVQGSDGNFYGTTYQGGPLYAVLRPGIVQGYFSYGTVFQVSTNGTFTNLVSFANSNGANPYAGLIQGSDGNLYGTTFSGGPNADNYGDDYGTLFRVILAPTIFSQPTNQTVLAGENVTFAVGATGFGPDRKS